MKGAREYAKLFKTGQYGRLYFVSGSHARGATFRIHVLPEGEKAIPNGNNNDCLNKDAVCVYGVISGQPGWTEAYGWLHTGAWCDDFLVLLELRRKEAEEEHETQVQSKEQKELSTMSREIELLGNY